MGLYSPEPRKTSCCPPAPVPPPLPSPPFSFCLPAFPHLAWKLGLGARVSGRVKACGREVESLLARRAPPFEALQEAQHNCTACHSCVPLSVSQADPMHPPLYWFLLGLRHLITYTCSWEMQAWLRGEGPFNEVSPPHSRGLYGTASLELNLGWVADSGGPEWVGRKWPRAGHHSGTPGTRPRVLW